MTANRTRRRFDDEWTYQHFHGCGIVRVCAILYQGDGKRVFNSESPKKFIPANIETLT